MTGVQMQIDAREIGSLRRRVDELARLDTEPLMKAVAQKVEEQTHARLHRTKTAPDGTSWRVWPATYAHTREPHHLLLEDTETLLGALSVRWDRDSAEIGSVMEHALDHQTGTPAGNGQDPIAAQPYPGLSAEDENDIALLVEDFVSDALRKAARK